MSNETIPTSIAMWGPTASGKTALLEAFEKSVRLFYGKPRSGLNYVLTRIDAEDAILGRQMETTSDAGLRSTDFLKTRRYEFSRNISKDVSPNAKIRLSSHLHTIGMRDIQGGLTSWGRAMDEGRRQEIYESRAFIENHVKNSESIIFVFDPDQAKTERGRQLINNSCETLERLIQEAQDRTKIKHIALTITKYDEHTFLPSHDPFDAFETQFRFAMPHIHRIKQLVDQINYFIVSSFGFKNDGSKNSDPLDGTGRLADESQWMPHQVEAPFFWIFEEIEKERIQKFGGKNSRQYLKLHIPYPRPVDTHDPRERAKVYANR